MEYFEASSDFNPFPPGLSSDFYKIIKSFCSILEIPVTFFDNYEEIKWECNSEKKICNFFDVYRTQNSTCTKCLSSSAEIASKLGEPYIFSCSAGFIIIAVSLILKGKLTGCFMAGPIAMEKINENVITNIFNVNRKNVVPQTYSKLIMFLKNMKIYTPKGIDHISTLFNSCIMSSIIQNKDYKKINVQFKEQTKIGENLQRLKRQNKPIIYPYTIEKKLITKIKSGDSKGALETMHILLNEILIIEAGNLSLVKTRMMELYGVLSRIAIENNSSFQKVLNVNFDYNNSLNEVNSIQELRVWASEMVNFFCNNIFGSTYSGNSYVVSQAVQLIKTNYMNKISLGKVAKTLYINKSYLSLQFKHELGITFTDYLNSIRIKVSKDLLSTTNLSILDISLYSGFEDQSYFTKVFKKIEGCMPKEYRKMIKTRNKQNLT